MAKGLSQVSPGYTNTAGVVKIIKTASDNSVLRPSITASRTSGVSPCTVVFSCDATTDSGRDSHEVLKELGFYFDFDDQSAGTWARGHNLASKNIQIGGAMAAHTFIVADGGGSQTFRVMVSVENPAGDTAQAYVDITVQAQDGYYSAANTIAVSTSLDTGDSGLWTSGHDRNVPSGATLSNTLPDWDAVDGKRIMLRRGEDFSGLTQTGGDSGEFLFRYGEKNVVVTWFGDEADAKPELDTFWLGSEQASRSFPYTYTAANFSSWGGYNENITLEGLKVRYIEAPKSWKHFGLHDIDMDYSSESMSCRIKLGGENEYDASNPGPTNHIYPTGFYMSEVDMVGSSTNDSVSNTNFFASGAAPMNFCGVIGCKFDYAVEHNFRTMGAERWVWHNNDFDGNHQLTLKGRLIVRGSGYKQVSGWLANTTMDDAGQTANTEAQIPRNRWNVIQNNKFTVGTRITDEGIVYFDGTETGSMSVGDSVTQVSTGATGEVTNVTSTRLYLRNTTGTFNNSNAIETDASNYFTPSAGPTTPEHSPWDVQAAMDTTKLALTDDTLVIQNNQVSTADTASGAPIAFAGRWLTEGQNSKDGTVNSSMMNDTSSTKDLRNTDLGSGTPSIPVEVNGNETALPIPTSPR